MNDDFIITSQEHFNSLEKRWVREISSWANTGDPLVDYERIIEYFNDLSDKIDLYFTQRKVVYLGRTEQRIISFRKIPAGSKGNLKRFDKAL
jgi:hypothetical protein